VATTPPTHDSIRVWKQFTYEDAPKLWSNRYFISAAAPSGQHVNAMDAVCNLEVAIYPSVVEIVKAEYIQAGSDLPVNEKTYTLTGTFAAANMQGTPGDCAAVVKYTTSQRTSKNHPIYLFNYYHGVVCNATLPADHLHAAQKTAIEAYAQDWVNGITYGGGAGVLLRCGPRGAIALSRSVDQYIRHRDFT
jgi:hypothetical protein